MADRQPPAGPPEAGPPEDEQLIAQATQEELRAELATAEPSASQVLASAISDYVDGINADEQGVIAAALRHRLPLRRLYHHLLEQRQMAGEIEQAAAAGDDRQDLVLVLDRASLQLRETAPGSGQFLLRLQLGKDLRPPPGSRPVLHLIWNDENARIVFPEPTAGVTHYLLRAGDVRLRRLTADAGRRHPATRYRLVL